MLTLQDDRNLVVIGGDGSPKWATNTNTDSPQAAPEAPAAAAPAPAPVEEAPAAPAART